MYYYVPQNVVHFIYVPQVPHIWYTCGTKTSPPQDGNKFQIWYSKSEKVENQPL